MCFLNLYYIADTYYVYGFMNFLICLESILQIHLVITMKPEVQILHEI